MNPRVFREYDIRGHGDADFPDDGLKGFGHGGSLPWTLILSRAGPDRGSGSSGFPPWDYEN